MWARPLHAFEEPMGQIVSSATAYMQRCHCPPKSRLVTLHYHCYSALVYGSPAITTFYVGFWLDSVTMLTHVGKGEGQLSWPRICGKLSPRLIIHHDTLTQCRPGRYFDDRLIWVPRMEAVWGNFGLVGWPYVIGVTRIAYYIIDKCIVKTEWLFVSPPWKNNL